MSLTYYFLRHGETTASKEGGFCGASDVDLMPEGYQMAEDFADSYKSIEWAAIFSSPQKRAINTALPLCRAVGLDLQIKDGFREISYGQWEGKNHDQVNRQFHDDYLKWIADQGWNAPTGGEKGVEVARRSLSALEEVEKSCCTGNILIVSHKATIRIMLCSLLGLDVGHFRDRICMPVASVSIVEMRDSGPLLHVMGEMSYTREHVHL